MYTFEQVAAEVNEFHLFGQFSRCKRLHEGSYTELVTQ